MYANQGVTREFRNGINGLRTLPSRQPQAYECHAGRPSYHTHQVASELSIGTEKQYWQFGLISYGSGSAAQFTLSI